MHARTGQPCEGKSGKGDTSRRRCEGWTSPSKAAANGCLESPRSWTESSSRLVAQVLTPILDPTFSASSFGYSPGRNAHQAIRQVQATVKDGRSVAVDIDLAKFFDTVNHDVLMNLLGKTIADKRLLALIGRYRRAGVLVGGR